MAKRAFLVLTMMIAAGCSIFSPKNNSLNEVKNQSNILVGSNQLAKELNEEEVEHIRKSVSLLFKEDKFRSFGCSFGDKGACKLSFSVKNKDKGKETIKDKDFDLNKKDYEFALSVVSGMWQENPPTHVASFYCLLDVQKPYKPTCRVYAFYERNYDKDIKPFVIKLPNRS